MVLLNSLGEDILDSVNQHQRIGIHDGVGVDFVDSDNIGPVKIAGGEEDVVIVLGENYEDLPVAGLDIVENLDELLGLGGLHGERLYQGDSVLLRLVREGGNAGEALDLLVELGPVETRDRTEHAAAADEDVGLEGAVTCTAAALLATELLGAVGNLAAILGLGIAVTLVGEILDDVEIDDVVVRGHSEYVLRENHLLSGCRSVNFQNFQFHTLKPPQLHKNPSLRERSP